MSEVQLRSVPVPRATEEWVLRLKERPNINDQVMAVHRALLDDESSRDRYMHYLDAIYDSQAVEGSLADDDTFAALMIREKSKAMDGLADVANANMATIRKALAVVLRRYHMSRKERRYQVEGETVPGAGNDG